MPLESKVFSGTKKLHDEIEKKPFLKRYNQKVHTLTDHYRHLTQLLPIYQALEKKLNNPHFFLQLPEALQYLLTLSEKIKTDLQFLEFHVSKKYKNQVLQSTKNYVEHINQLDMKKNEIEILSHFAVRIWGDLHGGQALKDYTLDLFKRERIYIDNEKGVGFYCHSKEALKIFNHQVDALQFDDENKKNLIHFCNDSFGAHIKMVEELESTRRLETQNHCNLFQKAVLVGATVAGIALAGVTIANR